MSHSKKIKLRNITISSQEALAVLNIIHATKGKTIISFTTDAIIAHAKALEAESPPCFGHSEKLEYLLKLSSKADYQRLKDEKPSLLQIILQAIHDTKFDLYTMDIGTLRKAIKPKKSSSVTLYTVALAVKYGFHEEEGTISKTSSK